MRANVEARNSNGETALHYAAKIGQMDCIEFLVSHGADVNAMNRDGIMPLDYMKEQNINF